MRTIGAPGAGGSTQAHLGALGAIEVIGTIAPGAEASPQAPIGALGAIEALGALGPGAGSPQDHHRLEE